MEIKKFINILSNKLYFIIEILSYVNMNTWSLPITLGNMEIDVNHY